MNLNWKSLAPAGLAVSFGLLLCTLPAFGQTTTIEGVVKGLDGMPLKDAVVKIDRTDIKGTYPVKTDKKGHYGHYGLPMGTFDVTVVVDGQVKDLMHGVHPTPGMPATINFDLKATAALAAGGPPTPEQEKAMTKEQKDALEKANKAREAALAHNKDLNDAYNAGRTALDCADHGKPGQLSDPTATDSKPCPTEDAATFKAKMYDSAVESFLKASMLDDMQVAVLTGLADAYVGAAGQKTGAESAALYEKGFDAYRKAIMLKGDDPAYYNNFALALARDKKLDEAKANLDKAIQLDSAGAGKYHYNMGALLVNNGQSDAAGDEFKKCLALDPTYADCDFQWGVTLAAQAGVDAKTGKITPAPGTLEALQKYLDLRPDGPHAAEAKELITQLGGTLSTSFQNPNAPAAGKKKK